MEKIDKKKLIAAMRAANPFASDAAIERRADALLLTLDERLIPNLAQWVQGEEISDIFIGQYCVKAVMEIRGDDDFLGALEALSLYARDEKAGTFEIWRRRG